MNKNDREKIRARRFAQLEDEIKSLNADLAIVRFSNGALRAALYTSEETNRELRKQVSRLQDRVAEVARQRDEARAGEAEALKMLMAERKERGE